MATPSPAPSNNSTDTAAATTTPATASKILAQTPTSTNIKSISSPSKSAFSFQRDQPKNLRGLNKPKCSQCGNVARSRCPYESCKSCCAKAENPCPIHVLKQAGTVPDKKPASTSLFDQKSNDASQPGTSLRVSSLRQLSQFNGTQVPFRPRKPPTRKEAAALNQWRFSKLKEYKERDIEAENEAFDRYMQNVSLLEEAFLVNSSPDTPIDPSSTSKEENTRKIILGFKAQLRSNLKRSDNFKRRIQDIVDQGLSKLQSRDLTDFEESLGAKDLDGHKETKKLKKTKDARAERASAIDELTDKLNKARNEEDLQTCLNMKCQLFNQPVECCSTGNVADTSKEQTLDNGPKPKHELNILPPKLWRRTEVDHESLHTIDVHFSSLDQIEDL